MTRILRGEVWTRGRQYTQLAQLPSTGETLLPCCIPQSCTLFWPHLALNFLSRYDTDVKHAQIIIILAAATLAQLTKA